MAETGLSPGYRGAQAFLIDGTGEVTWTGVRLEALKTAGLALDELQQVFFLGADGNARGEASFAIDNQGAPALALPAGGEPTFASVGGEPAFLTRDAEGRLFLPLAQGQQPVLVQDVRPFRHALGLGFARLELPRAGVPASRARVELRYPVEWIPLYEGLAPATRLHLLDASDVVLLALLAGGLEWLLVLGGVPRRRRWGLVGLAVALGALSGRALAVALVLVAAPLLALGVALIVRRLTGAARAHALLGAAAGVVAAIAIVAATNVVGRWGASGFVGPSPMNYASQPELAEKHRGLADGEVAAAAPAREARAPAYEGLPAKIKIPWGARRTAFERELLATDAPRRVFVVLVASRLHAALGTAAALLLLALALLHRRDLAAGARTFAGRFRRERAEGA